MNVEFRNISDLNLTSILPFGSEKLILNVNTEILNPTIQFYKVLVVSMIPPYSYNE